MAEQLRTIYKDINNVDLYVAGLAEDHLEGGSLGEVFTTIIAKQFEAIRDGDRFWYENASNGLFSEKELADIKATKLSDVIERNTDVSDLRENIFILNIHGTNGDDNLSGTQLADIFVGSKGNDHIDGGGSQEDLIDYSNSQDPITVRFDGVLKGTNTLDQVALDAWAGLQDLANKGNQTARQISNLHKQFFGHSISGFFNTSEVEPEQLLTATGSEDPIQDGIFFDQISNIKYSLSYPFNSTLYAFF